MEAWTHRIDGWFFDKNVSMNVVVEAIVLEKVDRLQSVRQGAVEDS